MSNRLSAVTSIVAVLGLGVAAVGLAILAALILRAAIQYTYEIHGPVAGLGIVLLLAGLVGFGIAALVEYLLWGG